MYFNKDSYDEEVDEYLKPRHYLMGNNLNLHIKEEKPNINFNMNELKEKKIFEIVEITHINYKYKKTNTLF